MPRFVITGTDTDIGKSVFAAGLAQLLDAYYWKPIQSGLEGKSDCQLVYELGVPRDKIIPEAYRLKTSCSPHEAAQIDEVVIEQAQLRPPEVTGSLVIEGAGGVLVPITPEVPFADLFAEWQLPVILVARTRLGTINHSLLSVEALRSRKVPVHGIAFIGDPNEETETTISRIGKVRRLGRLPMIGNLDAPSLKRTFVNHFKLEDFR